MMRVRLYEKNNDARRLAEVVRVLNDGGVIVYPTGTTYALGCHALKERAVERICRIKGIDPKEHPLAMVCLDMSVVSRYAEVSTANFKLIKRNTPGGFTFLLPALRKLPQVMRMRKDKEVGIRLPASPIVHELLTLLDAPLMTASLPIEEVDPECHTHPDLVAEQMEAQVDLFIDGGEGQYALTTVVDCTGDEPEVLREGEHALM